MKDAGGTGASTAGWLGGRGAAEAVSVTGATGLWAQGAVICRVPPAPGVLRQRVPVRSRAALYITALVALEPGASFMTVPNEAKSAVWRARFGCLRAGPRVVQLGSQRALAAVLTSGRECAAPGRGLRAAGQAVRPSAEHGRPEVRLTLGAAVSADSSAEAQTRRHEHA